MIGSSQKAHLFENVFTVIVLLCFADVFVSQFEARMGMTVLPGALNPFLSILFNGIYLLTAFLLIGHAKEAFTILKKETFLLCLLALVFLSTLWSPEPGLTFRRAIGLFGTSLFGLYFSLRYDLDEQLTLLSIAFGIAVIGSILVTLIHPAWGISDNPILGKAYVELGDAHQGAWRGLFLTKNSLGRIMVISALVFACALAKQKHKIINLILFGSACTLVILSQSKTALLALIVILPLIYLYKIFTLHRTLRYALYCFLLCTLLVATLLVFDNSGKLLSDMGRDTTFSGRTDLWAQVYDMIIKHPILGYGYDAFWTPRNPQTLHIWNIIGWEAPHAHNGFLDLMLCVGFVGVGIFISGLLKTFYCGIATITTTHNTVVIRPLLFISLLLITNVTESAILANNSILWFLYVSSTLSVYVSMKQRTSSQLSSIEGCLV